MIVNITRQARRDRAHPRDGYTYKYLLAIENQREKQRICALFLNRPPHPLVMCMNRNVNALFYVTVTPVLLDGC